VRIVAFVLGLVAAALGGLWLLQGLGVVRIRPLLCLAACEAVEKPSPVWALIGLAVLVAGAASLVYAARRRRKA
jgi:hypothetical protein